MKSWCFSCFYTQTSEARQRDIISYLTNGMMKDDVLYLPVWDVSIVWLLREDNSISCGVKMGENLSILLFECWEMMFLYLGVRMSRDYVPISKCTNVERWCSRKQMMFPRLTAWIASWWRVNHELPSVDIEIWLSRLKVSPPWAISAYCQDEAYGGVPGQGTSLAVPTAADWHGHSTQDCGNTGQAMPD